MNAHAKNLHMLEIVAEGLNGLLGEVAFVGGATTSLYLPDNVEAAESEIRGTEDVDCVIEVSSRISYAEIEKQLRKLGFEHVPEGPLCRWTYSGITVDIMPTDPKILGFSNRWYPEGLATAEEKGLPNGKRIRVFTVSYFLASKAEAFAGRGRGDFHASKDFEDIVTVLDGRPNIREEIANAPKDVREFLRKSVQNWESDPRFAESLMAQLPASQRSVEGARRVLDILRNIP